MTAACSRRAAARADAIGRSAPAIASPSARRATPAPSMPSRISISMPGRHVVARRVINDGRGFIAELLAKAIDGNALADVVADEDKEGLLAFVRSFGALRADNLYGGSGRSGFAQLAGAGVMTGKIEEKI